MIKEQLLSGKPIKTRYGTKARNKMKPLIGNPLEALGKGIEIDVILPTMLSCASVEELSVDEAADLLDDHFAFDPKEDRMSFLVKQFYEFAKGHPAKEARLMVEALDKGFAEYFEAQKKENGNAIAPLESNTLSTSST